MISTFAYFSFYSRTSKSIVVCSSHSLMMCSIEMVLLACCVVSKGFLAKVTVILFSHYQPRNVYTISKACEVASLYKVVMSLCGHCLFDLYLFHILKWFIPPRPSSFSSCKNPVFLRFQLKYYVILNLIIWSFSQHRVVLFGSRLKTNGLFLKNDGRILLGTHLDCICVVVVF